MMLMIRVDFLPKIVFTDTQQYKIDYINLSDIICSKFDKKQYFPRSFFYLNRIGIHSD